VKQIDRLASRLLVLAPTGRALMLHLDPGFRAPFWVTPGGGLDAGESFEEAARRELYEEVGRSDLELGPCIAQADVEFTWEDWFVRQHERTFTVAAPDEFEAVVVHAGIEPIVGTNWFSANELRSLEEAVYPEGLAQLVEETTR
jgi:8-oxo-dGTP diphosphatase